MHGNKPALGGKCCGAEKCCLQSISISTTHLTSPHWVADGKKHPKNTCMFKTGWRDSGEKELKLLEANKVKDTLKQSKTGLQIIEQQINKCFSDSRGYSGIMWFNGCYANACCCFFFLHHIYGLHLSWRLAKQHYIVHWTEYLIMGLNNAVHRFTDSLKHLKKKRMF